EALGQRDGFLPVGSFANHGNVLRGAQNGAQPGSNDRVVIRKYHTNHITWHVDSPFRSLRGPQRHGDPDWRGRVLALRGPVAAPGRTSPSPSKSGFVPAS